MNDTVSYSVNVAGEESGRRFEGTFVVKVKLSHRETLKEDELYRAALGADAAGASGDARAIARAIAYLAVRVTKAPDWWRECNGGLDLEDLDVLAEVNNKAQEAVKKEREAYSKAAAEARGELKKVVAASE